MGANDVQGRSLAVCFAGAAFFGVLLPVAWVMVTIAASTLATGRTQQETVGYAMILTGPAAAVLGAVGGFAVGFFGDPARWLRRWAIFGVAGLALAFAFNAWMLVDTRPPASASQAR